MTIYDRIRARRTELGMTVEELAHKMGYKDKSSISKIENGKADIPQSKVLAFAQALNTTTAYLIGAETISVPPGFEPLPRMVKKPLIGNIACGQPITAEQNIEDYVDVPENVQCDFCLRCKGESMIDAGIHDGDVVYIHIQPEVENGQIAAVRIDGEATLKRVFWNEQAQTLQLLAENRDYPHMVFTGPILDTVHIEGLAVGFTHWF